jgi:hypothetical protein
MLTNKPVSFDNYIKSIEMKYLRLLCITGVIICTTYANAQVIQDLPLKDSTMLFEKLYLHIDREVYSPGDDIWFKTYLVNGVDHKLISGFTNIYVQLISEEGNIIDNRLLLSVHGVANNDFHLPDSLMEGTYTIRAYTEYLQNFGEEGLFYKKIAVINASKSSNRKNIYDKGNEIDISFLPEGGNLVLNTVNHIAFKAIDESGKGINVSGIVLDENGEVVNTFTTTYRGMGKFILTPQEGKTYYAKIDGFPDFSYRFKDIQPNGIALHYQTNENDLQFTLNRNTAINGKQSYIVAALHRGTELFREEIEMEESQYPVEIYSGFFPAGISKFVVMDLKENILAERLVFVNDWESKTLRINSIKEKYLQREKAELEITSLFDNEDEIVTGGLSVSVAHEDYLSEGGISQTIESYLLLDSELKGSLECPSCCFINEESITADEKLDHVMMVNGWRSYYWDDLQKYKELILPHKDDAGLTIKGKVQTLLGENPVKGETVELGPFSSQFLILRDTTDVRGRFSFDRLYLQDSARIMVNVKNKKGKNINAEIFCEPTLVFDSTIAISEVKTINQVTLKIEIPEEYNQTAYYRYLAEQEFKLKEGSILLKEVEIKGELRSDPVITGLFGFIDRSYMPSDDDRKNYSDLQKYLEFEVPNIYVVEEGIRIGTASISPRIYIDGFIPSIPLEFMQMNDIAKIEIINPSKTDPAFFVGDQAVGAPSNRGGVISIITKTGFGKFNDEFVRVIPGRTNPLLRGFRQPREFYSPKYLMTEHDSKEKIPDQRPTLYWNPTLEMEGSKSVVEIYTSDMPGRYRIIVEGISQKGTICFGTAQIEVVSVNNEN